MEYGEFIDAIRNMSWWWILVPLALALMTIAGVILIVLNS